MTQADNLYGQVIINYCVERQIEELFNTGKIKGTIHLSFGQEAVDVGIIMAHQHPMVFGNHRSHGQYLAATDNDIEGLLKQIHEGNTQHLYFEDKFLSHGIQGAVSSLATGYAYCMKKNAPGRRVLCFIGDGTFGEGNLYESFNLASTFRLPITFVIIDNGYSISRTLNRIESFEDFACHISKAFGFEFLCFWKGECSDVQKVYDYVNSRYSKLSGPCIIYCKTKRLCGHSCNDTQMYRPAEEKSRQYFDLHSPMRYIPEHYNKHEVVNWVEDSVDKYLQSRDQ